MRRGGPTAESYSCRTYLLSRGEGSLPQKESGTSLYMEHNFINYHTTHKQAPPPCPPSPTTGFRWGIFRSGSQTSSTTPARCWRRSCRPFLHPRIRRGGRAPPTLLLRRRYPSRKTHTNRPSKTTLCMTLDRRNAIFLEQYALVAKASRNVLLSGTSTRSELG